MEDRFENTVLRHVCQDVWTDNILHIFDEYNCKYFDELMIKESN
jgi:hypothetical protein